MSDLDGLWEVRPLPGVRKRIRGARGETLLLGGAAGRRRSAASTENSS